MENRLLSMNIINRYNMIDTKINVDYIMEQYRIIEYKWMNVRPPRITPSYEIKYSQYIPIKADPVGRFIERKIDNEREVRNFYIDITRVTNKFTEEERKYYIYRYFNGYSKESIAAKLNRSRNGITQIECSCILKLALGFNEEVLKKEEQKMILK